MTFTGFDPDAVSWLDELPSWDAERYAAGKDRLRSGLVRPGLDLITELAERLDADLTVAPRSSVSPLHTDLRFAPPGAPRYKDHLLLTAWEGTGKKAAPTLWVRIDSAGVGFASGVALTPPARDRWREAVAGSDGARLAACLDNLVVTRAAEIAGDQLKQVPRPYEADHPREGLLRRNAFQVRFVEELPPVIDGPGFVDWCAERLEALLPVHRWLVHKVAESKETS